VEASAALSPSWPLVASRFTTSLADIACHAAASPSVFAFVATLMPALRRSLNSKMLFRHVPHLALILVNIPHPGCARRIDLTDRQYRYSRLAGVSQRGQWEKGMILLSICQTCKYGNLDFLNSFAAAKRTFMTSQRVCGQRRTRRRQLAGLSQ